MEDINEYVEQREEAIAEMLEEERVVKYQKIQSQMFVFTIFSVMIIICGSMWIVWMMLTSNNYSVSTLVGWAYGMMLMIPASSILPTVILGKYGKLQKEIIKDSFEQFLKKRFIYKVEVKVPEKEECNKSEIKEIYDTSKYEPEKFIPEEELEEYLQIMQEVPEEAVDEISEEQCVIDDIWKYFNKFLFDIQLEKFELEKYDKNIQLYKIDNQEYDLYYLKMKVNTQKEIYIKEFFYNYKKTTFENSIMEITTNREGQKLELYELTDVQKDALLLIHKKYKFYFRLVIKDGYFRILCKKYKRGELKKELRTNYDFVNAIDEIVKEFINI